MSEYSKRTWKDGETITAEKLNNMEDGIKAAHSSKSNTNHAAPTPAHGEGTGTNYGHVKLSDATNGTSNANGGVAATPAAVKAAYDLANTAKSEATAAKEAADKKAPTYSYGTEDLTAGSSALETGKLHFVYE